MSTQRVARHGQFLTDDIPPMLLKCLETNHWTNLLDLGCGDGALLYALSEKGYLTDKPVYALDISHHRLRVVKEINKSFGCIVSNACETPVADSSVDLLISTQVIEHVEDDEAMVREMRRILVDHGTVYLSTVFKKPYGWYFYRRDGKWVLDPTHLREYTRDSQLLDILKRQGFNVLETKKTLDGRPVIDSLVRRLGAGRFIYRNRIFKLLRKLRAPIPGYYNWEIICTKTDDVRA